MAPATVEKVVMRIGLKRLGHASFRASQVDNPSVRLWFVKSTRRMAFFFTIPMRRMRPIMEYILKDWPWAHSPRNAPDKLKGRATRTVTGSMKLLNCAPRIM
jgi:hypothetical protein